MILQRFFHFLLFGSIFISLCAVALCMETNILLQLPFNSVGFYVFVFGATLVQYNLHYVSKTVAIDGSPRLHWSKHQKRTHYILIGMGIVMIIYGLVNFPLHHYVVLLTLGVIGFVYSFPFLPVMGTRKRLKDFGLLKIITLSLMWTLVTVWFPANQLPYDTLVFLFVFIKRFIFIFVLCLVFDIRDASVDASHGIQTLPVLIGIRNAYFICYGLLMLLLCINLAEYFVTGSKFIGAFFISILATALVVRYSQKNNSDITCLFGVDGMMLLQALLVWLFSLKL